MSYNINKYPDGAKYITVDKFDRDITFRLNSYEDLWLLNQLVDVYYKAGLIPTITIPNLIDAQADRRFKENQPHGLKLVCEFLNNLPAEFKIFHPHNPEVVEALMDNVEIIDNSEFVREVFKNLILTRFGGGFDHFQRDGYYNSLILMSSDAGGFKPLIKLCDKINWEGETFSASKHRKYDGNETRLTQFIDRNDFKGKDILIIDDISVYGGTFKGLSKLLRERNFGKLYLAVSHITVENLGDDPVTNYFDKVFTTNSKFDNYFKLNRKKDGGIQPQNLEIIKLF